MKNLWALVPLKVLTHAKSRLADTLDAAQRRDLALAMARDVVTALAHTRGIRRVVLVSDIPALPRLLGVPGALDDVGQIGQISARTGDLNGDLRVAASLAAQSGASHALIAHADLPLLTPAAIARFIGTEGDAPLRAAASGQSGGTNLLLAPLPLPLPLVFGRNSLARFREEAQRAGLPLDVVTDPLLGADIDDFTDYQALRNRYARDRRCHGATATLLAGKGAVATTLHA